MKRLGHALLMLLLHCLALMPLWLLYLIADVAAAVLYHLVRYRRAVVHRNLRESFPDYSPAQIKAIERRFYRNFADYAVETAKLLHISDRTIMRRVQFDGLEHIDSLLDSGRSVVCYFSHCGNWEWITSITLHSRYGHDASVKFCQVYRPLKDSWFDALMLRLRSGFGSVSLPKKTTLRHLLQYRRDGIRTVTGFMSDQKPSHADESHIVEFLHHPTAIITGTETLARRLDMAVVYLDMYKPARGRYRLQVRPMAESAADTAPGELTDRYAALLQRTIERNPPIWLWSHNRWKNKVTLNKSDE